MNIPHFGIARQYANLKEELLEVTDNVLSIGKLVDGKNTTHFEQWLTTRTNTKYAVAVHSGTQALEIIARFYKQEHDRELNIHPENCITNYENITPKIYIPNITYPATVNAFINSGFRISLSDTDTYGIIKEAVYPLVCIVGLYGKQPWPSTSIKYSKLHIIDGAQHWLVCNGNVGLGMAISFDPTKNLAAHGNGGAIVTNNIELYKYAINYRDNGKITRYMSPGTNSKMSELDCAHLLVKTKYIDDWQNRRKQIADYWCEEFSELPLSCLANSKDNTPHALQKFVLYTDNRNSLHTALILDGIQTKIHYEYALGDLPICSTFEKPDMLSNSVMLTRGVLSLPLYPELTDVEVEYIASKVIDFYMRDK